MHSGYLCVILAVAICGNIFYKACLYNAMQHIMNIYNKL